MGTDNVFPKEFTGDGAGISPPLSWKKGPEGTKSYAVIMHHVDREGKTKWYWTLWDIPAEVTSLPKNSTKIGTIGSNEMSRVPGYGPPNSKGPGTKVYTITIYALSDKPTFAVPAYRVNREVLLDAMKRLILDTSELKVSHSR
jgi:Raf kinase inhibitor-like YbhB/YbcL family protein